MRKQWTMRVLPPISALAACVLTFTLARNLVDTEAGGGQLTGPLVDLCLVGSVTLLVCAALLFAGRLMVTMVTLVAALLCLPLLLSRIVPSSLSWLSDVPSSVVPAHAVNFDPLAVSGTVAVLVVAVACVAAGHRVDANPSNGREMRR